MSTLVVGEALVDVVRAAGGTRSHPGGSPANVALGLARLGHAVELLTRIGRDPDGDLVRAHLEGDGVRLAPGSVVDATTSRAVAHLDEAGAATYDFDLVWDLADADREVTAGHVHTGSIACHLAPGADQVRRLVARARSVATVSYDPNLRPTLIGPADRERPVVEALVAASDLVKVSDEDLAFLYPGEAVEAVLDRWAATGPAVVVATLGPHGSTGRTASGERVRLPAEPVTVADTVGAGDAFMAGLLSALLDAGALGGRPARERLATATGADLGAAMTRAARVAGVTVSRPGADPPRRPELDLPEG